MIDKEGDHVHEVCTGLFGNRVLPRKITCIPITVQSLHDVGVQLTNGRNRLPNAWQRGRVDTSGIGLELANEFIDCRN